MIDNEIIYNKEYLVILPVIDSNLKEEFEYTFKNVFLFNEKKDSVKQIKTIKKSHFKQIIFVDYCVQYKEIINNLLTFPILTAHCLPIFFYKIFLKICKNYRFFTKTSPIHSPNSERLYQSLRF